MNRFSILLGIFSLFIIYNLLTINFNVVRAAPVRQIPLTARLATADFSNATDGTYSVRFSIYSVDRATSDPFPSDADAASRLWTETKNVTVVRGFFRTFLGDTTALPTTLDFNSGTFYLAIRIGTDPEMVPRFKIGSAAFAINSALLQGLEPGNSANNLLKLNSSAGIDLTGAIKTSGGLDLQNSQASNFRVENVAANPTAGNAGRLIFNTSDKLLRVDTGSGIQVVGGDLQQVTDLGATTTKSITVGGLTTSGTGTVVSGGQVRVGQFSSAPTALGTGALYYDTATNQMYVWNGSAWRTTDASSASVDLQGAYNAGNTLTTSNVRDVSFTLADTATDSNFLVNIASGSTSKFAVQNAGTDVVRVTSSAITLAPGAGAGVTISPVAGTSGSPTLLTLTAPAHTTLTASTEAIDVNLNLARTVQFATGALTTQRAAVIQAPTYGFVAASTLSNATTLAVTGAPAAGTNATLTNSAAIRVSAGAVGSGTTNSYGLYVDAQTGGTNNYGATFASGNVGIGDTSPLALLTVGSGDLFQVAGATGSLTIDNASNTGQVSVEGTILDIDSLDFTGVGSISSFGAALTLTSSSGQNIVLQPTGSGDAVFNFSNSSSNVLVDAATNVDTATTAFRVDADAAGVNSTAITVDYETVGTVALTQNAINEILTVSHTTNARTIRGLNLSVTDAGSVANTLVGLNINVTTANASNTAYAAIFQGGNVGIGDTTPASLLTVGNGDLVQITSNGDITQAPSARTSGSPTLYTLTGPAHTTLTASTEAIDVNLNLARTVQFATGALTTQRAVLIQAPTYAFVGASTLTTAATLAISGAPIAGTNATITNAYGLLVNAGQATAVPIVARGAASQSANLQEWQNSSGSAVIKALVEGASNNRGRLVIQQSDGTVGFDFSYESGATINRSTTFSGTSLSLSSTNFTQTTAQSTFTLGAATKIIVNAATNDHTDTTGAIDLDVDSATNGVPGIDVNVENVSTATSGTVTISGISVSPVQSATGAGGTHEVVGVYVQAATTTGVLAGTQNQYGVRIANQGVASTETAYGLYIDAQSGSGTANYSFISAGTASNVGIGDTTPLSLLTVGSGDLVQITSNGDITQAPSARTSGSPTLYTLTGPAHTTLTASTEAIDVNLNLARTVQFATGALTTQRAFLVQAPTYSFVAASTLTTAVTQDVTAAPTAGTNATITNAIGLRVGGATTQVSAAGLIYNAIQVPAHTLTLTGTTQVTSTGPAGVSIGQLTVTDSSAVTVDNAASVYIANAPTGGGSVTLTNPYALWIDNGNARFDGTIISTAQSSSTTDGAIWNDSTQKSITTYVDGINQKLSGSIFSSTATATVSNSTTETSVVGSGVGTTTLPVNFFVAGKTIRVTARGVLSDAATPGTIDIRIKLGSTAVCDTAAQTPAGSLSNRYWEAECLITNRTTGATGTVFGQGMFTLSTSATDAAFFDMENSSTTTIDTTATQAVGVTAQWGTADVSNSISGTNVVFEVLN